MFKGHEAFVSVVHESRLIHSSKMRSNTMAQLECFVTGRRGQKDTARHWLR